MNNCHQVFLFVVFFSFFLWEKKVGGVTKDVKSNQGERKSSKKKDTEENLKG